MKLYLLIIGFTLFSIACSNDEEPVANPNPDPKPSGAPTVQAAPTYDIITTENIVYAQGLSHESLNSENATAVDLLIDAYIPDNDSDNRPAFMFIHGGGFVSGDKQNSAITNLADFYSSRGWAFFSISYRLQDAFGTIIKAEQDIAIIIQCTTRYKSRKIRAEFSYL